MNLGWYLLSYVLLLVVIWAIAKFYSLLKENGKRWVGRVSRGLVLAVLLATVVALVGEYLPPPTGMIHIATGFKF